MTVPDSAVQGHYCTLLYSSHDPDPNVSSRVNKEANVLGGMKDGKVEQEDGETEEKNMGEKEKTQKV